MFAIVGGSGLTKLAALQAPRRQSVRTPYGEPSAELLVGTFAGREVVFLPRHGDGHALAPHEINYRANIDALRRLGVTDVFAVAAVGGIRADLRRGKTGAVGCAHGVEHVAQQFVQFRRIEPIHRPTDPQQTRIPHAKNRPDHGCTARSSTRTARPTPRSSTAPSRANSIFSALSPRPAAELTTTAMAA